MNWRFSDLILGLLFMAIDWFLVASFLALASVVVSSVANGAEPPRYEVTNRTTPQPAFTVTNRIGAVPAKRQTDLTKMDYAELRRRVLSEHASGFLFVGVPDTQSNGYMYHAWVPSGFHGFADGMYLCENVNGKAMMSPWDEYKPQPMNSAASGVAAVPFRPFQSGQSSSTPGIIAQPAAGRSTSSPVISRTGSIRTGVFTMGRSGLTNCTSFG